MATRPKTCSCTWSDMSVCYFSNGLPDQTFFSARTRTRRHQPGTDVRPVCVNIPVKPDDSPMVSLHFSSRTLHAHQRPSMGYWPTCVSLMYIVHARGRANRTVSSSHSRKFGRIVIDTKSSYFTLYRVALDLQVEGRGLVSISRRLIVADLIGWQMILDVLFVEIGLPLRWSRKLYCVRNFKGALRGDWRKITTALTRNWAEIFDWRWDWSVYWEENICVICDGNFSWRHNCSESSARKSTFYWVL